MFFKKRKPLNAMKDKNMDSNQLEKNCEDPPSKPSDQNKSASNQSSYSDDVFGEYVQKNKDENDRPSILNQRDISQVMADIKEQRSKAFNSVLLDTLSPQLESNEVQKRYFKERLMYYILWILAAQIIPIVLIMLICFLNICFEIPFMKDISEEIFSTMISFMKYYISAVIVEFIGLLAIMVNFVFDKSIVVLMKELFKKD